MGDVRKLEPQTSCFLNFLGGAGYECGTTVRGTGAVRRCGGTGTVRRCGVRVRCDGAGYGCGATVRAGKLICQPKLAQLACKCFFLQVEYDYSTCYVVPPLS